jgi:hypothetical protein
VLQDVRHAVRLWRRHPSVTVLVVLTLAIGIAATTVVFSLADVILGIHCHSRMATGSSPSTG